MFKKRLRRYCEYHFDKKIQVFNVHEYGKNRKKHWHRVVFNHDCQDKKLFTVKNGNTLYTSESLSKIWDSGHHTIGEVTEASAMYQAQYTQKDLTYGNTEALKAHSKHSGIGRDYFLQHYDQILRLGYLPFNGRKYPIPRYFLKLGHKHYAHFYDQSYFFDTPQRKKQYATFQAGQANRHMADLYKQFMSGREKLIEELSEEWEQQIEQFIFNKEKPDFAKAGENAEYDLRNKINKNKF